MMNPNVNMGGMNMPMQGPSSMMGGGPMGNNISGQMSNPGGMRWVERPVTEEANLVAYREANPLRTALIYAAIYIAVTAASIPGALVLTLLGEAFARTFGHVDPDLRFVWAIGLGVWVLVYSHGLWRLR